MDGINTWYLPSIVKCAEKKPKKLGAIMAVIVWQLDLQLPMQSVPITTDVVISNLNQGEQASTLPYFLTCPFGQLTKKITCPTQSFNCSKKLIKITKTRE